jgi:hypothetical protein
LCRNRKKVRAAFPINISLVNQFQISLVNQRGRLQSVVGSFASQVLSRLTVKLGVNERHQFVNSLMISVAPLSQDFRNVLFSGVRLTHFNNIVIQNARAINFKNKTPLFLPKKLETVFFPASR